jgi:hypothetical protein
MYSPSTPVLTSWIPPINKIVKIVEVNPCTSEGRIPKIGMSKILKTRMNKRPEKESIDIKIPR